MNFRHIHSSLAIAAVIVSVANAGLEFDGTLKEVELPPDERSVEIDFSFRNDTEKAVTITKYDASCSCVSMRIQGGKLRYDPGESGMLRAAFDMGNFSGTVDKSIQLWLDGDPEPSPSVRLTARIAIPVLVEIEPKSLRWEIDEAPEPKRITVKMNRDEPIHVLAASTSNQDFAIERRTVEEGRHYEITVTPSQTDIPALAVIQIETDCEIARHANQRAFAVIRRAPEPAAPQTTIPR